MELFVKAERPELMPFRANPTDGGLDLRSKNEVWVYNNSTLVGTGVRTKIPAGYVGLLIPRSSLRKKGLAMTNSVGVIDADYRGEIMAALHTYQGGAVLINKDERIVQLVIVPVGFTTPVQSDETDEEWNDTARGTGGFGSTGTH